VRLSNLFSYLFVNVRKLFKKMKKSIFLILFGVIVTTVFSQNKALIKFKESTVDIGNVKQEEGSVKSVFYFKNEGNDTLRLIYVQPSCGCTSVKYTLDPVMPGQKGEIEAIYDAAKYPGDFKKSIIVRSNDPDNSTVLLYITGYVIPKGKTLLERNYPQSYGNLKVKNNHLSFEKVKNTEKITMKFKVYNAWGSPMKIEFKDIPKWITISPAKLKIKSQKDAEIDVTFDGKKKKELGLEFVRIPMLTNDTLMTEKVMHISAEVVEDFTKLTSEQLANAAEISFATTEYNFPDAKEGDKVTYDFEFTNTGKTELILRKVTAGCGCITATIAENTIKPGEKSKINVVFDTKKWVGEQHKTVTIICNDPKQPNITLNIIGKVAKAI
jgi:hypothetical protein